MTIDFVAGVATIVPDDSDAATLYRDALGLPLRGEAEYLHTNAVRGVKHLGIWPLSMAARSCFGRDAWPDDLPVPQATIEFEVGSVDAVEEAEQELVAAGRTLVHAAKLEPWGQTVARLQDPGGLLIGITYTPWMHDSDDA